MDAKHISIAKPLGLFIQITYLFAIYASLLALYFHNFIPEPATKAFAERVSLYFSICFSISLFYLSINNLMPNPTWYQHSKFTKLVLMLVSVPLYYFFIWISLAFFLPLVYTSVAGETKTTNEVVSREYVDSRKSCDYRLKFESVDTPMFHFCLRPEIYDQMAQGEYAVVTTIKQSELGYYIKSAKFAEGKIKSVLVNQKNIQSHALLVVILVLSASLTFVYLKKYQNKS
jgi:hypothetical protein